MRADVGAPLPNNKPHDGSPANGTGLSIAIVDAKMVLKFTAAINPVDAGAVSAYAFL
jgi:hypothetical protein